MKQFAVLSVTLICLLSTFYALSDQPDPGTPAAVNAAGEIQKAGESEASDDTREIQDPGESGASIDEKEIQKPTESEALDAAATYLKNKDGRTVEKTEFIAWGTFSENDTYWPIKFRMAFKRQGSDKLSQKEYALKISTDRDGNWQAAPYWAWRTDFK
jgi:hypothetical protein